MQMKATELRIGNWINIPKVYICGIVNDESVTAIIESVHKHGVRYKTLTGQYGEYNYEYLRPICIAEEILLKADFELKYDFDGSGYVNEKSGHSVFKLYEDWNYGVSFLSGPFNGITKVPYLHKLQNIYYALTGQELEIKL